MKVLVMFSVLLVLTGCSHVDNRVKINSKKESSEQRDQSDSGLKDELLQLMEESEKDEPEKSSDSQEKSMLTSNLS